MKGWKVLSLIFLFSLNFVKFKTFLRSVHVKFLSITSKNTLVCIMFYRIIKDINEKFSRLTTLNINSGQEDAYKGTTRGLEGARNAW